MTVIRKIIMTVALAAIVLGIVLGIVGIITGASFNRMCTLAFGGVEEAKSFWISFGKSYADTAVDIFTKAKALIEPLLPVSQAAPAAPIV